MSTGEYPHPALPADEEAHLVVEELGRLGGHAVEWAVAPAERHRTNVDARLRERAATGGPRSSVMLWQGHGSSTGDEAFLATYDSDEDTGVAPEDLARQIRTEWGTRRAEDGAWALVVIEACGASRFAQLVSSVLQGRANVQQRLAVVVVGSGGTSYLGDFRAALTQAIDSYQINDEEIRPHDLVGRISDWLDARWVADLDLRRANPIPGSAPGKAASPPRSTSTRRSAPSSPRSPTTSAAASSPRRRARTRVSSPGTSSAGPASGPRSPPGCAPRGPAWLVVTGRGGSGKSALLGNVLVYAKPGLRDLLTHADRLGVELDGFRPTLRVVVAHPAPASVVVERQPTQADFTVSPNPRSRRNPMHAARSNPRASSGKSLRRNPTRCSDARPSIS